MVHYFITSYHNICNYKKRERLTKEFLERYPNVIVLEEIYNESILKGYKVFETKCDKIGFINNLQINKFLEVHKYTVDSITFIDSDVILYENFFEKVINFLEDVKEEPMFIQPFSKVEIIFDDPKKITRKHSGAISSNDVNYNTGFIYTYNKLFLEKIDYKFPEILLIGSFDTFLYLCLLNELEGLKKYLSNFNKNQLIDLMSFKHKINGVKYNYIEGEIKTFTHGKYINRYYSQRLSLYRDLTDEKIMDYFKNRKEDDYY